MAQCPLCPAISHHPSSCFRASDARIDGQWPGGPVQWLRGDKGSQARRPPACQGSACLRQGGWRAGTQAARTQAGTQADTGRMVSVLPTSTPPRKPRKGSPHKMTGKRHTFLHISTCKIHQASLGDPGRRLGNFPGVLVVFVPSRCRGGAARHPACAREGSQLRPWVPVAGDGEDGGCREGCGWGSGAMGLMWWIKDTVVIEIN